MIETCIYELLEFEELEYLQTREIEKYALIC